LPLETNLSVIQAHALWLIAQAVDAAGGSNVGGQIAADLRRYIQSPKDPDSNPAAQRLSSDQIGIFAGDSTPFQDFFDAFLDNLNGLLRQYHWIEASASASSSDSWDARTTLGAMSRNLVDECADNVTWVPPA
jgi:hypothetical protein